MPVCTQEARGVGVVDRAGQTWGAGLSQRLNAMGVSAFVLKYRLVEYGHPTPLQDVLRAVRLVRSRAAEFLVHTTDDTSDVFRRG
jgi:acetyl esterase/lipase